MTEPRKDLTGKTFGHLSVVCQAEDYVMKNGKHKTKWHCMCDCGRYVDVIVDNLTRGNSKTCGTCRRSEATTTHGGRYTRLYSIWTNMKSRCYDEMCKSYKSYGMRGIRICDEWRDDFTAFRDWAINNGYSDELTIDRINNDGDYCPENCRWANAKEQAGNRRSSRYVTVGNETKSLAEWADYLGYSRSIFHARAKLYHTSIEEQVEILVQTHSKTA